MRVLGLSAFYHDSAAALVDDGRIIAAAQEERAFFADQKASKPISFGRVAGPLGTRLQGFADHDRATRARIESMQAQREQALARLRGDIATADRQQRTIKVQVLSSRSRNHASE